MDSKTALYRFYSQTGELLYVGISINPITRASQHARDKAWYEEIARSAIEWFPTREEALKAEKTAIQTERPLHNIRHNEASQIVQLANQSRIIWTCEVCNKKTNTRVFGDGYLRVTWGDITRFKAKRDKALLKLSSDTLDLDDLDIEIVKWHCYHDKCDPSKSGRMARSTIDVSDLDTPFAFLDWTAELLSTDWIQLTNWDELCRHVSSYGI